MIEPKWARMDGPDPAVAGTMVASSLTTTDAVSRLVMDPVRDRLSHVASPVTAEITTSGEVPRKALDEDTR